MKLYTVKYLAVALFVGSLAVIADVTGAVAQNVNVTGSKVPLPQTSKMKLAGDAANYIKRECGSDVKYKLCDVFVQSDPKGSLVGYVLFVFLRRGPPVR